MERGNGCPYFKSTCNGTRCIFLSPEEWRLRQHSLREYCLKGGNRCSVRGRILARISNNIFLCDLRRNEKEVREMR